MTDPMRPIDGDKHKVIVEKIVEQLEEMGVPTPKNGDVGCHYATAEGENYIINSRSISCDSDSPVAIELVVSPKYMMDNMDTIGKAFALLPNLVKKAVQKAREENTGSADMFSVTHNSNKTQLLN